MSYATRLTLALELISSKNEWGARNFATLLEKLPTLSTNLLTQAEPLEVDTTKGPSPESVGTFYLNNAVLNSFEILF